MRAKVRQGRRLRSVPAGVRQDGQRPVARLVCRRHRRAGDDGECARPRPQEASKRKLRLSLKVLVLNCGSSSIKYQLHDAATHAVLAEGLVSRIGEDPAIPDHGRALELMLDSLVDPKTGVL